MREEKIIMTIGEVYANREKFFLAPDAPPSERRELPLLEKQAIVDEAFRGMPIAHIECYRIKEANGSSHYLIRKGWPQLQALLDFRDGKFPTWSNEDKHKWESGQP